MNLNMRTHGLKKSTREKMKTQDSVLIMNDEDTYLL